MNKTFRLTTSFLLITSLAGLTMARSGNKRLGIADFINNPETLKGRVIQVQARVIAINADGKSLDLFDSQSKTRIAVRLTQLRKSERAALIHTDVRDVVVSGRASVEGGLLTIDAQSVAPVAANNETVKVLKNANEIWN